MKNNNYPSQIQKHTRLLSFTFMMLACLLMNANVFATTYQIGSGTTTNTQRPLYTCYTYNYSQSIYTAAELTAAGVPASNQIITQIRYFYATAAATPANWNSWAVYIGNTAQSTLASTTNWVSAGSMTQVFNGTIVPPAVGNWMTITLTTPFTWTAGSNLVVAIDENSASYSCTAAWRVYTGVGNRYMLYYSDPTNPNPAAPPTANLAPSTIIPQIQFEMTGASPCSGTPAPGNTVLTSGSNPTCASSSISLGLQNSTPGSGVTYQWMSDIGAGYSNISGATQSSYSVSQSVATSYKCSVTCSGNTTISNPLAVGQNLPTQCYCDVTGGSSTYYLSNVTITGGITNFNNTSSTSASGYTNYSGSIGCSQLQSSSVNFSIATGPSGNTFGIGIWVDWNQNGSFLDAGENVYNSNAYLSSATGSFAVPATATGGLTRMRVCAGYIPATAVPCTPTTYTEYEDYAFTVVVPNNCSGTPNPGNTISSAPAPCSGTSFTLSFQNAITTVGNTYQWQSSPNNTTYTNIAGATNATLTTSQTSTNYYRCTVTCSFSTSANSNPVQVTNTTGITCLVYCASAATYTADEEIYSVTVNGSSTPAAYANANGCVTAAPGSGSLLNRYSNFFPLGALSTVSVGQSVPFTVGEDECDGATYFAFGTSIWVDFNQNGSFADPGEQVFVESATLAGPRNVTGSFNIPVTATQGLTGMRIMVAEGYSGSGLVPCLSPGYGETEDWIINIAGLPANPANPTEVGVPNCATGGNLQPTGSAPSGETWYWQTTASGTSTATPVSGLYNILSNGTYYIRSRNNTYLTWSSGAGSLTVSDFPTGPAAPTVTAPGGNPACGAVTLVSATASAGSTNYWQGTNSTGISTASVADDGTTNTPYAAPANGTYYLRGRDNTSFCWSNSTATVVTINPLPTITSISASPTTICPGATSQLTANIPGLAAGLATGYCIPGYTYGCAFPDIISNVTFAGINNSTACGEGVNLGYDPVFTTPNPNINAGGTYTYSITTSGDVEGAATWIDYNHSGTFDANEEVFHGYLATNPAVYSGSVTIPATAVGGQTIMRVRCTYAADPDNNPCGSVTYGETEDYYVNIIPAANLTLAWTPSGSLSNSTIYNPVASPTSNTTYNVTVTNTSTNCQNSANVPVAVPATPPAPNGTGASTVCGSGTVTVSATGTGGQLNWWSAPSGGSSLGTNVSSINVSVTTADITVYVEESNGTCSGPRTAVLAHYTPAPTVSVSSPNTAICNPGGADATLNATGADPNYVYTWSPAPLSTSGTYNETALAHPSSTTTYTVTGSNSGTGCSALGTITVSVSQSPVSTGVTASPPTVCQGNSSSLNAGTFLTSSITTGLAGGNGSYGNAFNIVATNTVKIHYFSMLINVGSGNAEVYYIPGGFAGPSLSSSAGWTLVGNTTYTSTSATVPTLINLDANVTIPAGQTYGFVVVIATTNTNVYTNGTAFGNTWASDANISIKEGCGGSGLGGTFALTNTPRNFNGTVTYDVGDPTLTYLWTGSNLSSTSIYNPVATFSTATPSYSVVISNASGCTTNGSITLSQPASNPGNTNSTNNGPVCATVSFTLSMANPPLGASYQWEKSTNGGSTWSAIAGATNTTYTTTQSVATSYRCQAGCTGSAVASNPIAIAQNPFYNCYCASAATTIADEEIYHITINGNSTPAAYADANGCSTAAPGPGSILNEYSNFSTLGPIATMLLGTSNSFTVSENECDAGTFYAFGTSIWIDLNQNGSFADAGEQMFVESSTAVGPRDVIGTFTIPATATPGLTAMRITCAEGFSGASLTPCLSYGYGETEDWVVSIGAPNATDNSPRCNGDTLKLFTPAPGTSYSWSGPNGFSSTAANPMIPHASPAASGVYTVVITFPGGSTVSASVTSTVNPSPVVTPTADPAFCQGTQDLHLNSNAPTAVSYSWTGPGGYTSTTANPVRTSTVASMTGAYKVVVTDALTCKDSATVGATVYALPPADITPIGSTNLCSGQTTTDLQATGGTGYLWNTGETTDLITVAAGGTYTVTVTDIHNCVNTDSQVMTESAAPAAPIVTPAGPLNLCSSDGGATYSSATLTVTNYGSNLLWSTSETDVSITVNYGDIFNVTYTDGNGCYSVSNPVVTNALLASSDPTSVSSNITTNSVNNICLGNNVTLSVNGGSLGDGADWHWYEGTGACGTGTARGTGSSVTLTPSTTGVHHYTVRAEGTCNNTACSSIDVTVSTAPPSGTVHITAAPTSGCSGTVAAVSVNAVSGATYYSWSATSGALLGTTSVGPFVVGPLQTSSPTVWVQYNSPPPGASGFNVCGFAGNACGQSNAICAWARAKVSQPGVISGNIIGCANGNNTYSIGAVAGADTYTWSITGAAGINGGGATLTTASPSITVNFAGGWTSGTLSVYASLNCGYSSAPRTLAISNTPAQPGAITGPAGVCPNASTSFSVAAVTGAATYNWTCSVAGAVITPSANSCSIAFPAVIPAGSTVCVTAVSSCGNASVIRCKGIGNGTPNIPGNISGPNSGQCEQSGVSYTISPVSGATSYTWTATTGGTIVPPNNLSGATVNFNASFTTVTISVTANNSCGSSGARTLAVAGAPGMPGAISGNAAPCHGNVESYTTAGSGGATSYAWTVPSTGGWSIIGGQGSGNLLVLVGTTAGNIGVTASNSCGTSGVRNLPIATPCRQAQVDATIGTTSATLYPNPTTGKTTVKFESANEAKYVISVVDVTGRVIISDEMTAAEGINMHELDLTNVAKGIYLVRMESAGEQTQLLKVTVE